MTTPHEDRVMTIKEVARYLHISAITAHRLANRGMLPGAKIGHQWRFYRENIERMVRDPQLLGRRR